MSCTNSGAPVPKGSLTQTISLTPFQTVLNSIYNEDEAEFEELLRQEASLMDICDGPWYLIHHLYDNDWTRGIEIYLSLGGKLDWRTEDYFTSLSNIPLFVVGGQTILHILAKRKSNQAALRDAILTYPELNVTDFNGSLPLDIANAVVDAKYLHREGLQVRQRTRLKRDAIEFAHINSRDGAVLHGGELNDGISVVSISTAFRDELVHAIADVEEKVPNSMHKYGKVLLPKMEVLIKEIVKAVLSAHLHDIVHLHAFYIKYNEAVQTSLSMHRDDSTFTINLCLFNASHGADLVFDDLDCYTYPHIALSGIVHRGDMRHHVTPLIDGERENIIIWVTCRAP